MTITGSMSVWRPEGTKEFGPKTSPHNHFPRGLGLRSIAAAKRGASGASYASPADALSTGSISDFAENGFVR